jgi:hypothetical protein
MAAFSGVKCCYAPLCATVLASLLFASNATGQQLTAAQVKALPECSPAKTNNSCQLVIDRENLLSPPTVQLYSNQTLTVIVKKPKPFERYFLDLQTAQATLTPDVASGIVQGLVPSLGKLAEFHGLDFTQGRLAVADQCAVPEITGAALPAATHVIDVMPAFRKCIAQLAKKAVDIYQSLEPFVAPDSLTPNGPAGGADPSVVQGPISDFLQSEFVLSSKITRISGDPGLKTTDSVSISELSDLQKLADGVANDLLGFSQRIRDLVGLNNGSIDCAALLRNTPAGGVDRCLSITSRRDDSRVYQKMVTRTITYALNTLNLVSNSQEAAPDPSKKKSLATVAINFADTPTGFSALRWEASAGVFFSTLPVRSFSVAPVFTKGAVTDNTVAQNILHPTVVPFAAANYRLTNDLGWTRWKSAIYWTGAVGVNPNTVSADFASGLSISWRALMLSGLWHYGHDLRLTQGFAVGQSLGAAFKSSLPTQTFWTSSFAIGVSVRVPSLTGR